MPSDQKIEWCVRSKYIQHSLIVQNTQIFLIRRYKCLLEFVPCSDVFVNGANSIEEGRSLVLARINEACGPLPLQKEGSVRQIEKHNKNITTEWQRSVLSLHRYFQVVMRTRSHYKHNDITTFLCRYAASVNQSLEPITEYFICSLHRYILFGIQNGSFKMEWWFNQRISWYIYQDR